MPARRLRDLNWGSISNPNQIEVITAEQMLDVDVALALSAHRGRPEVISARPERRV
jgi:hypothetical protein